MIKNMYTAEPSVIDTYKMKIINLLISLFSIIKTKALECVSLLIKNACKDLKYLT